MNIAILIAGLSLGALSSFHCVGMCGPLALALPVQNLGRTKKQFALFSYHIGRVTTYALLGAIFGLLGRQVYIAGFQRWFSILLGIMVLLILAQFIYSKQSIQPGIINQFQNKVRQLMGYFLRARKPFSFLLLGMANGLLPCGMVYLAIAGALNSNSLWDGIFFMTAFGLGTFPAMLTLSFFGFMANITARNNIKKLTPYIIAVMGILLILRGLNMGIPYLSPLLEPTHGSAIQCH